MQMKRWNLPLFYLCLYLLSIINSSSPSKIQISIKSGFTAGRRHLEIEILTCKQSTAGFLCDLWGLKTFLLQLLAFKAVTVLYFSTLFLSRLLGCQQPEIFIQSTPECSLTASKKFNCKCLILAQTRSHAAYKSVHLSV